MPQNGCTLPLRSNTRDIVTAHRDLEFLFRFNVRSRINFTRVSAVAWQIFFFVPNIFFVTLYDLFWHILLRDTKFQKDISVQIENYTYLASLLLSAYLVVFIDIHFVTSKTCIDSLRYVMMSLPPIRFCYQVFVLNNTTFVFSFQRKSCQILLLHSATNTQFPHQTTSEQCTVFES